MVSARRRLPCHSHASSDYSPFRRARARCHNERQQQQLTIHPEPPQQAIDDLLKELGPSSTAEPAKSGKENAIASTSSPLSSSPGCPKGYGADLSAFLGSPLLGGPLSEVPLEESNQKKMKGRKGKKGGNSTETAQDDAPQTQQNQKKKDKSKKKDRESEHKSNSGHGGNDGRRGSLWAGSAFLKSPPSEDLPMPSATILAGVPAGVSQSDGTAELKKMLNLGF